ncbi:enoyl-CoA hydratase/isomerase family protein [Streptomyces nigrescens]|uniref:enoyl-CoA hydratase/isomerase family protein n=1 Tax=Streptomyces nigrescens TaxID=1920 RepID=UPI00367C8DF0
MRTRCCAGSRTTSSRWTGCRNCSRPSPRADVLPSFVCAAPPGELGAHQEWIDHCYAADAVEEIVDRLLENGAPGAEAAAESVLAKSPTALKVTLAALRAARGLGPLKAVLEQEYRVSYAALSAPDLVEGIRAQVIDKDRTPRWTPATLTEVTDDDVARFFAPLGDRETVLRNWATGGPVRAAALWDDPAVADPVRVRAGAVVIRDEQMLLIGFEEEDGQPFYEIPGGGVETGETLHAAAVRELREETGLAGSVIKEVARVWKDNRREHYFLLKAEGEIGAREQLDNYGGTPVWVPIDLLPTTPVWPRRLAWRIAHRHTAGWPTPPAELADSIHDLQADCTW